MKKILFSDVDGTLLDGYKYYHELDLKMVDDLHKNGHLFAIATGRCLNELKDLPNFSKIKYDYLILSNGAQILDNKGNYLLNEKIDQNQAISIFEYVLANYPEMMLTYTNQNATYGLYKGKQYLFDRGNLVEIDYVGYGKGNYDIFSLYDYENHNIDNLKKIQAYIKKNYPEIEGQFNQHFLDIAIKGHSKGSGLQFLADYLKDVETYAIGDSYNDLSMLEAADYGYTFNRAKQEIKDRVNFLVDYVYQVIEIML